MTSLILKAAYAQCHFKTAMKTVNQVVELLTFASQLWEENTEVLSENCIKITKGIYSMMVGFIGFLVNDGTVSKASDEVLEEMTRVRVGESAIIIRVFVEGFVRAFLEGIELVETVNATLVATLEELKIIAKGLQVPSYVSFKSAENLQEAIGKKASLQQSSN